MTDKLRAGRVRRLLADLGQPSAAPTTPESEGEAELDPELEVQTDEVSLRKKKKRRKPVEDDSPDKPTDITGSY
jgi:hypothetical protein